MTTYQPLAGRKVLVNQCPLVHSEGRVPKREAMCLRDRYLGLAANQKQHQVLHGKDPPTRFWGSYFNLLLPVISLSILLEGACVRALTYFCSHPHPYPLRQKRGTRVKVGIWLGAGGVAVPSAHPPPPLFFPHLLIILFFRSIPLCSVLWAKLLAVGSR